MTESNGSLSPNGGGGQGAARRHHRQRSSVSVRKRVSQNTLRDGADAPDNALSRPGSGTEAGTSVDPLSPTKYAPGETRPEGFGHTSAKASTSSQPPLAPLDTQMRRASRESRRSSKLLPSPREDEVGKEESRAEARTLSKSVAGDDYFSTSAPFLPSRVMSPTRMNQQASNMDPVILSPQSLEYGSRDSLFAKTTKEMGGEVGADVATTRTELNLFDDDENDVNENVVKTVDAENLLEIGMAPPSETSTPKEASTKTSKSELRSGPEPSSTPFGSGANLESSSKSAAKAIVASVKAPSSVGVESLPSTSAAAASSSEPPAPPPKERIDGGRKPERATTGPSLPSKTPQHRATTSISSTTSGSPIRTPASTPRSSRTTVASSPTSSAGRISNSSAVGVPKRLSLLNGGGVGAAASIASMPSSSNSTSSTDSSYGARGPPSTPTIVSRRNSVMSNRRMSLAYIPSPSTNTATRALAQSEFGPTTPSTASSLGFTAQRGMTTPKSVLAEASQLPSSAASQQRLSARKKEDGDTVMTQHTEMLSRIAEKERRCLELREALMKEESDLKELRGEWQASVHRELANESITTSPTRSRNKGVLARAASSSSSGLLNNDINSHIRNGNLSATATPSTTAQLASNGSSLSSSAPSSAVPAAMATSETEEAKGASILLDGSNVQSIASEKIKDLGKRLPSGWGAQLTNFLDQLAAPPGSDEERKEEASAMGTGGSDVAAAATTSRATNSSADSILRQGGLDVLAEEDDEGASPRVGSTKVSKPLPPVVASQASAHEQKHKKRQSVFGTLASLQKSVEEGLLGLPPKGASPEIGNAEDGDSSKDAESPAIGSVTATKGDEGGWGAWQKRLKEARDNASGLLAKAEASLGRAMTMDELIAIEPGRTNPTTTTMTINGFDEDNEREKAALSELTWLKSLSPTIRQADGIPIKDETQTTRLDPEMLLELEKGNGLAPPGGVGLGLGTASAKNQRRTSSSSANSNSSNQTATGAASGTARKRMSGSMPITSPGSSSTAEGSFMNMLSSAWSGSSTTPTSNATRRPSLSPRLSSDGGGRSNGSNSTETKGPSEANPTMHGRSSSRMAARLAAAASGASSSSASNTLSGAGQTKSALSDSSNSSGQRTQTKAKNSNNNNWDWDAPLSQDEKKTVHSNTSGKIKDRLFEASQQQQSEDKTDGKDEDNWGW